MKRSGVELVEQFLFYLIVFLILREWLVPIMQLTDTGYFTLFNLFIALCLIMSFLGWPLLVSWFLKTGFILWSLVYVYNDSGLSDWAFLSYELKYNVAVLLNGEWGLVSDPVRSSLFFVLIWMLIYLIQYWITVRFTIFYFFVLTVFFIATLDTFTDYDGTTAIIKIVVLGLMMTSLLFVKRLMQSTNAQLKWSNYFVYVAPIVVFIGVAGVIAAILPKSEPQWTDPVPYFKDWAGIGHTGESISQVGYGDNDESLGGPFIGDNTLVYEVETPIRQYWRVETKDTYTSKGWERTATLDSERILEQSDKVPFSIMPGDKEAKEVFIYPQADHPFLVQAYGTTNYVLNNPDDTLKFNAANEKVVAMAVDVERHLSGYELLFQEPTYSFTELKEVTTSSQVDERFLQLPETLPTRVKDLAHEITADYESVYDKARAIESYFKRGNFQYETTNVAIPSAGEDYVDQFLFETMLGYCDNFSTSMVVLLRSVGIQARWVKGFASGERVTSSNGMHLYQVTNNDAHSWVEAYIDGVGWVPFEPTIGFSNPVSINYDVDMPADDLAQQQEKPEEVVPEPEEQDKKEQAASARNSAIDFSKWQWFLYVFGAIVLIAAIVLWKKRGIWQPKWAVQMHQSKLNNAETFEDGYFVLLKQLERIHLKRNDDETLQQFAKRVDAQLETTKMGELTAVYEQVIYSKTAANIIDAEVKAIWEYLINRTSS
ncbi:MAG: transglutaminaseTgpA domain-containing protein [Solibacillus sp.]